ncbi:glycosyltransferase family 4 protein [Polynucleobacter brandtiae]|uniref:Glycosyl transferase family 4 n=1 Tax=Polynucleobacter brandtiae TaxID=1938816 RepID=A0A2M8VJI6_9BURK|nr:glycosyltransferase family 4 protein [Polynucleobacter brandtiae]PJI77162.1 glycosyl transferase family 4 [Polynucleobacter brandtiae]
MLAAIKASLKSGVDISPLNFWDKKSDFNIVHIWGYDLQHYNSIKWAKLSGKKVVLTGLFPYITLKSRARNFASSFIGPGVLRNKMLEWVDAITVVNDEQQRYVNSVLGYPMERIYVAPNIVDDKFFLAESPVAKSYVLSVGNVCLRKNQLQLVKACKKLNVPLVLVGNVLPGDERYGIEIENELQAYSNATWLKGIESASSELIDIYRGAKIFALPSHTETQPISVLEAMAGQIPVLIADQPYARQKFFKHAFLVDANSQSSIERGLKKIFENSKLGIASFELIEECKETSVGKTYRNIYKCVMEHTI